MMRTLFLVFLLFSAPCLRAQTGDASVSLTADKDRLIVGEQARVTLTVQHDPSRSRISFPHVPDSFGKLEVVEKDKIDTVKNGRFTMYRQLLLVAGFDSGLYSIPPISMSVQPRSGAPYILRTGSPAFLVQTVPVDTTRPFRPIKEIMAVESSWLDYIWLIIGAVTALVAVGLLVYFLRQKKHKLPPPVTPPEPLHERALKMLDRLEAEELWQKGEVKAYYVQLTDILRGYIEARFGVRAMERTTDELTVAAGSHPELSRHAEQLHRILATADMAKFARSEPLPAEHVAAIQGTRDLIRASIPRPDESLAAMPSAGDPSGGPQSGNMSAGHSSTAARGNTAMPDRPGDGSPINPTGL